MLVLSILALSYLAPRRHQPGMTLRDYFAAKAMQGLIEVVATNDQDYIAAEAYAIADAMLAERVK